MICPVSVNCIVLSKNYQGSYCWENLKSFPGLESNFCRTLHRIIPCPGQAVHVHEIFKLNTLWLWVNPIYFINAHTISGVLHELVKQEFFQGFSRPLQHFFYNSTNPRIPGIPEAVRTLNYEPVMTTATMTEYFFINPWRCLKSLVQPCF